MTQGNFGAVVVRGVEDLGISITSDATGVYGVTGSVGAMFGNLPRLSSIAKGFGLYRFNRAVLRYQPICGTATNGIVAIGLTADMSTGAFTPATAYTTVSGLGSAGVGRVWESFVTTGDTVHNARPYFDCSSTGSTDTTQFLLLIGVTGATASTTLGRVWLEYECELVSPMSPSLNT